MNVCTTLSVFVYQHVNSEEKRITQYGVLQVSELALTPRYHTILFYFSTILNPLYYKSLVCKRYLNKTFVNTLLQVESRGESFPRTHPAVNFYTHTLTTYR